ncbi:MAG: dephospho-CoA kinase [Leptospirales bacterium]
MIVIGLTGGIASGKSYICRFFEREGVPVIHSDQLAREAVQIGTPALASIREAFPDVIAPDGTLNRKKLGKKIFASPADRQRLEGILHPRIRELFLKRLKSFDDTVPAIVYEVPLLFETGLDREMDLTVVVDVPESVQKERLVRRDGLPEEEASRRLSAQMSREERNRKPDYILSGNLPEEQIREKVRELMEIALSRNRSTRKEESEQERRKM